MRFELARERKRAGYATQRRFAEAFGASRRTVEDWERGACCPSVLTAAKVAEFLECSLDDLVRGEGGAGPASAGLASETKGETDE